MPLDENAISRRSRGAPPAAAHRVSGRPAKQLEDLRRAQPGCRRRSAARLQAERLQAERQVDRGRPQQVDRLHAEGEDPAAGEAGALLARPLRDQRGRRSPTRSSWSLQNRSLRLNCKGNFKNFVKAMNKNAALMEYLDTNDNRKDIPNENYARELQELFTLGVKDSNGNSELHPGGRRADRARLHRLGLRRQGQRLPGGRLHDFMSDFDGSPPVGARIADRRSSTSRPASSARSAPASPSPVNGEGPGRDRHRRRHHLPAPRQRHEEHGGAPHRASAPRVLRAARSAARASSIRPSAPARRASTPPGTSPPCSVASSSATSSTRRRRRPVRARRSR